MKFLRSLLKKLKIPILLIAGVCTVLGVIRFTTGSASAEIDESMAVPFRQAESKVGGFREGTMIVGTFAMHRDVVTDQYIERAESTISDSGQSNTYYKSDLAGGVWYDITNAEGLSDVYDEGTVATSEELEGLYIRYYVDENGVLTDLLTGELVNPFNIPNPYDIYNLPEMQSLKSAYDGLLYRQAQENPGPPRYYKWKLDLFYNRDGKRKNKGISINRHTPETDEIDRQINSIFNIMYKYFVQRKRYPEANKLMEVMEMLDAKRRYLIFDRLARDEENPPNLRDMDKNTELIPLMDKVGYKWKGNGRSFEQDREWMGDLLYGAPPDSLGLLEINLTGTGYITEHWDDRHFYNLDYVITALGQCREEVSKSHTAYSAKMVAEGTDVRTRAYKSAYEALLAGLGSPSARDGAMYDLMDISSIIDGNIKFKDRELSMLVNRLIPECDNIIAGDFSRGAGSSYQEGLRYGEAAPALKARLSEQRLNEPETHIGELQSLLLEQKKRVNSKEGLELMLRRLDLTDSWERSIPSDAYESFALGALEAHRTWLKMQARKIIEEDDSLKGAMSALEDQRLGLILERDMALDDGDGKLAAKIDGLIENLDGKIAEDMAGLYKQYNNATSTGQKMALGLSMGDNTIESAVDKLQDTVLAQIAENAGGIDGTIDGSTDGTTGADGTGDNGLIDGFDHDGQNDGTGEDGTGINDGTADGTGDGGESQDTGGGSGSQSGSNKDGSTDLGLSDMNTAGANALSALGELGAEDALANIANAVESAGGSDKDKQSVSDARDTAAANNGNSGFGKATGSLDENGIMGLIESILGKAFDDLDSKGKIIAAVATAEFGKTYSAAAPIGRKLMKTCIDERNPYGFYIIENPDPEGQYTSIKALSTACGWRYEYKNKVHTLSYKGNYYEMRVGDDIITDQNDKKLRLQGLLQTGPGLGNEDIPYLMDQEVKVLFKAVVEYVEKTKYGACFSQSMEAKKKELLKAFNEAIS